MWARILMPKGAAPRECAAATAGKARGPRPVTYIYVLFTIFCLLLAGCTGDAEPTSTPPPTQPLNPAPPTATAAAVQPTATLTLPPSAADLARTATAQAPTPDPTEETRSAQREIALGAVSAALDVPVQALSVAAVTGVRAGREIEGCGRASSGMALASILDGENVTEVLIDGQEAQICGTVSLYDDRPELFLTLDPVAADLVDLALTRAARSAEVETNAVVIDSVRPVEWASDTLGCETDAAPPEGSTSGGASGYRILLSVGERQFEYHTDFDRLIPCSVE